jgi:hypothetical protein
VSGFCEHYNDALGFIKGVEFDYMRDYYFIKESVVTE